MPDLVFQDTTKKDYASLQSPHLVQQGHGARRIQHPNRCSRAGGIQPDELLYQDVPFAAKALYQGRAVAVWQWEEGSATQAYRVGVSFPKRGMTRVIKMSLIELTNKWLKDNPTTRFILGIGSVILLAVLFFRFSGGTGFSVFAILTAGLAFLLFSIPFSVLLAPFALIPLLVLNEKSLKRRHKAYLPAIAQVEGGGIKRGLTAPESAVLLEMPLSKVLTLVMFGLLEKSIVSVTKDAPLTVEVTEEFRVLNRNDLNNDKERRQYRRDVAQAKGTIIHNYEDGYLTQLERHPGKPVRDIDFSTPTEALIKVTAAKMKGFDLSDTQEYYRRIIDRALEQAASLGEIETREKYLDKYLPWVLMNDNYPTVLTHRGHSYWPVWARTSRPIGGMGGSSKSSGPSIGGHTTLGDVSASFAGWAESTMGNLAATIMPGSLNIPGVKGGFIDLSGADRVTGDIFTALANSPAAVDGRGGGCAVRCARYPAPAG